MRDMLGREIKKHDVITYSTRRGSTLTVKVGVVVSIPMFGTLKVRGAIVEDFNAEEDTGDRLLEVDERISTITNTHAVIVLADFPATLRDLMEE